IPDEPEPCQLAIYTGAVTGLLLIYLDADGSKAEKPKKFNGNKWSAKQFRGVCQNLPVVVAPVNDGLGLAVVEGLEDGLSVFAGTGLGVWCAGAAGFMPALADVVPDYIETVTIYAHNDESGRTGAHDLAEKLTGLGIEVFIEGLA